MSLIKCPECGKEVSTAAAACPSCGYPVAGAQSAPRTGAPSGQILMEVRQSWWAYFWPIVFFWLVIPRSITHTHLASPCRDSIVVTISSTVVTSVRLPANTS